MKEKIKRYLIVSGIGIIITVILVIWKGAFKAETTQEMFRILCDCFTIPGAILVLFGLLVFCTNEGAFNAIGYGVKTAFEITFIRKQKKDRETYTDFTKRRAEKKKPFLYFIFVGLGFLLIAGILLIFYYCI